MSLSQPVWAGDCCQGACIPQASSRLLPPGTPLKPFPALCLLLLLVMGRSGIGSAVALMTDRGHHRTAELQAPLGREQM